MGKETGIEWCDHTFNAWRGCTKVSEGCKFCYAEAQYGSKIKGRAGLPIWGPTASRQPASESYWQQPLQWNREAEAAGVRRRVFCAPLADVFEGRLTCQNPEAYRVVTEGRARLFNLIAETPHLDWLLLTKRPHLIDNALIEVCRDSEIDGNILAGRWLRGMPPANVWIGTSVEDQKAADERIPHLLQIPATVRFLSCEPLLGAVDLSVPWEGETENSTLQVDWVIAGGESGPDARPMHPDWVRSIRNQCLEADVPFFFQQWGEWAAVEYGSDTGGKPCAVVCVSGAVHYQMTPSALENPVFMAKVGKKAAGNLLDGKKWEQFPEPGVVK